MIYIRVTIILPYIIYYIIFERENINFTYIFIPYNSFIDFR